MMHLKYIVCICNKFLGQSTTKSSNREAITLNVRTDMKSDDNKRQQQLSKHWLTHAGFKMLTMKCGKLEVVTRYECTGLYERKIQSIEPLSRTNNNTNESDYMHKAFYWLELYKRQLNHTMNISIVVFINLLIRFSNT